jgi:hypothetical protein
LAILPLTFELSFNNLRRACRIVWRKGNFFGVTFEDQSSLTISEAEVRVGELTLEGPVFSLLGDQPQLARLDDTEVLTDFASQIEKRNDDGRSDAHFAVGVAVVLALPVLISLGAYVAATVFLGAG